MRLITFVYQGKQSYGVVLHNDAILDLGSRLRERAPDVRAALTKNLLTEIASLASHAQPTLSCIAAKTERIKLGTSVINALFHVPVVLARRFATLDQFSQGRVIAGLGQGWVKDEFETANIPFQRRGKGFEDYIGALRAAWGPDPVQYEGRYYRIVESDIGPKPFQTQGPPLLFGVTAPASLERAARLADGINPVARSWSSLEQMANEFPEMVRHVGRDPHAMQMIVRSNSVVSRHTLPEPRSPFCGSLEQIREDIQRLASLGIRHVFFDLVAMPVDEQLRVLEQLL